MGLIRQFIKHLFEEIFDTVIGAVSRTEKTTQAVSAFTYKAQKGMIALSAYLLRIVTTFRPMLIAEHRDDVRVKIKGDGVHILEALANPIKKHLVDPCQMICLMYCDLCKETAYGALGGKRAKTYYLLKHLVCSKFHHVARPEDSQHHPIEQAKAHVCWRIVICSAFFSPKHCHGTEEIKFVKKPPYQTSTPETGDILSSETFHLVLTVSLWYILFHLLGASFPGFQSTLFYQERRLFASKISRLIYILAIGYSKITLELHNPG
jgi:hypothetical protein